MSQIRKIVQEEIGGIQPRLWLMQALVGLLPEGNCGRVRTRLYRALGLSVGSGTLLHGLLKWGTSTRLANVRIGKNCFINIEVFVDGAGVVTIGDRVGIGHHVRIITSDHEIGPPTARVGRLRYAAVTIEDGVWIAAGVTLLPGVTVGHGAIVAAGSVVTRDIPPNSLVGGIPAKVIRWLKDDEARETGNDPVPVLAESYSVGGR
jgi:maltose O-acetyltransferase